MCKKKFQSPCVCRNKLSNPRYLTVSVNSAEPCLQTTVRQQGLESTSIRHTQGWLKLIFPNIFDVDHIVYCYMNCIVYCKKYNKDVIIITIIPYTITKFKFKSI